MLYAHKLSLRYKSGAGVNCAKYIWKKKKNRISSSSRYPYSNRDKLDIIHAFLQQSSSSPRMLMTQIQKYCVYWCVWHYREYINYFCCLLHALYLYTTKVSGGFYIKYCIVVYVLHVTVNKVRPSFFFFFGFFRTLLLST